MLFKLNRSHNKKYWYDPDYLCFSLKVLAEKAETIKKQNPPTFYLAKVYNLWKWIPTLTRSRTFFFLIGWISFNCFFCLPLLLASSSFSMSSLGEENSLCFTLDMMSLGPTVLITSGSFSWLSSVWTWIQGIFLTEGQQQESSFFTAEPHRIQD